MTHRHDAPPLTDDDIPSGIWTLTPEVHEAMRLGMAERALRSQDPRQATVELEELLDHQPDHPIALRWLAAAETSAGEVLTARLAWESLVHSSSSSATVDPGAWVQLAHARLACVELNGAHEAVSEALDQAPWLAEAWYLKAMILEYLGHPADESEALYLRAHTLHPLACPLPLILDDPHALVRRALQATPDPERTLWNQLTVRIDDVPDAETLLDAVPPRSPRSLCLLDAFDDEGSPTLLRVFMSNLRHFPTPEMAQSALTEALIAEVQEWLRGAGPNPPP